MKKKMRKFADGDFVTAEGPNKMIDDDVRARAMRSVAPDDSPAGTSTYGEENESPITMTKTKSSVTATKPKGESPEEYKTRMEGLTKSQALENVSPEDYVTPAGMLKGMFKKVVSMGAKRAAAEVAKKPFAEEVASAASRIGKNDAAEMAIRNRAANVRGEANDAASLAVRNRAAKVRGEGNDATETAIRVRANKVINEGNDAAETAVRLRANNAANRTNNEAAKKVRERAGALGLKKGGSVMSSASRRADGCAVRGKTRA